MPLPPEVIDARERMNQAEAELRAYVDRGEHDSNKHRELVHNLRPPFTITKIELPRCFSLKRERDVVTRSLEGNQL